MIRDDRCPIAPGSAKEGCCFLRNHRTRAPTRLRASSPDTPDRIRDSKDRSNRTVPLWLDKRPPASFQKDGVQVECYPVAKGDSDYRQGSNRSCVSSYLHVKPRSKYSLDQVGSLPLHPGRPRRPFRVTG